MDKRSKSIDFDKEVYDFLTKVVILVGRADFFGKKISFCWGGVTLTSLNRDTFVTDFLKLKELFTKAFTFVAQGKK